jgi:hypothetical protein
VPQQPAKKSSAADATEFWGRIGSKFLRRPCGCSRNGAVAEPLVWAQMIKKVNERLAYVVKMAQAEA